MGSKIKETDLLKALNELEESVMKGDALESADTEGGFSTEGSALSSKAPSGRSDTKKSEKMAKMMSSSDVGSEEAESADEGSADDAESPDEGSADDESKDDGPPMMGKSFRERAGGDETMRKAIDVSDFLEAMVDQTSDVLGDVQKSLVHVQGQLSNRLAKSEAAQANFNTRLAKAIVQIGTSVSALTERLGVIVNQPHVPQRKAVLSKSEIHQPSLGGPSSEDVNGHSPERIQEWLFQKSIEGQIDPVVVTVFEQNGYNPEVLPAHVRKALINDLRK